MSNRFVAPRELNAKVSTKAQLYDTLEVDCKYKEQLMIDSGHGLTSI